MRRREILIELTSLLDVILIMIFVLLTQARGQTAAALESAEADRAAAEELRTELTLARSEADGFRQEAEALGRQLLTEDLVVDNSLVLTVSTAPGGAIRRESPGRDAVAIPYDWADDTFAANKLRATLLEDLRSAGEDAVFIVFQYDRQTIYRAEYDMITGVVREIKLEAKQRDIPLSFLELDTRR